MFVRVCMYVLSRAVCVCVLVCISIAPNMYHCYILLWGEQPWDSLEAGNLWLIV